MEMKMEMESGMHMIREVIYLKCYYLKWNCNWILKMELLGGFLELNLSKFTVTQRLKFPSRPNTVADIPPSPSISLDSPSSRSSHRHEHTAATKHA